MKRTTAREIAVQLSFLCKYKRKKMWTSCSMSFFNKEYYDTLADENELFAEYPEKSSRSISRVL